MPVGAVYAAPRQFSPLPRNKTNLIHGLILYSNVNKGLTAVFSGAKIVISAFLHRLYSPVISDTFPYFWAKNGGVDFSRNMTYVNFSGF
jgi:hypothetical protein